MRNTDKIQSAIQEVGGNLKTIQNRQQGAKFSKIKTPTQQNHFHTQKDSILQAIKEMVNKRGVNE